MTLNKQTKQSWMEFFFFVKIICLVCETKIMDCGCFHSISFLVYCAYIFVVWVFSLFVFCYLLFHFLSLVFASSFLRFISYFFFLSFALSCSFLFLPFWSFLRSQCFVCVSFLEPEWVLAVSVKKLFQFQAAVHKSWLNWSEIVSICVFTDWCVCVFRTQ